MLSEQPPSLDSKLWVTDYFSHIISVDKLYQDIGDTDGDFIDVPHTRRDPPHDSTVSVALLDTKIVYEGRVQLSKLNDHVKSPINHLDRSYDLTEDLRSLNILTWSLINLPTWKGGRVGKKFYPASPVGDNSEKDLKWSYSDTDPAFLIRTGFFASMRPGDGALLLNVNTTTSAFYPPLRLSTYIKLRFRNSADAASKELKGVKVTFEAEDDTDLSGTMRGIWKVAGETVSQVSFKINNSRRSCHKHMVTKYEAFNKRSPFNNNANAVNLGGPSPNESWYPADKLKIVAWQPIRKQLPSKFIRDMLVSAEKKPQVNKSLHAAALRELGINPQHPTYAKFGLKIADKLLPFKGHDLKAPSVLYGSTKSAPTGSTATWALTDILKSKEHESGGFKIPNTTYTKLLVVKIGNYANDQYVDDFLFYLKEDLPLYGFKTTTVHEIVGIDPPMGGSCYSRRACAATSFGAAYEELRSRNGSEKPALIIFLLPNQDITLYSDIKWWADCVQGVPTVYVTGDTIFKAVGKDPAKTQKPRKPKLTRRGRVLDPKVLGNLAMKINFKLGGINHQINGQTGLKAKTIIFGADVTHSGKGQDPGCPSLAGVVASNGDGSNKYLASARLQSNNTEFIEELEIMVVERLGDYYNRNQSLPEHILFYRDGVSESQFGMVKNEELPQIKRAAARALRGAKIRSTIEITLLVVGKRHHARFFKDTKDQMSRNFGPGLCVDSDVVCHNQYSFYLQSHDSPLGTARSGHYVVIENGSGYSPTELQNITNSICFAGSRATKALSICTPARYADLLCDRLRCYMRPVFDGQMLSQLKDNPVEDYRTPKIIWGATKSNPWHAGVRDIMFYL